MSTIFLDLNVSRASQGAGTGQGGTGTGLARGWNSGPPLPQTNRAVAGKESALNPAREFAAGGHVAEESRTRAGQSRLRRGQLAGIHRDCGYCLNPTTV